MTHLLSLMWRKAQCFRAEIMAPFKGIIMTPLKLLTICLAAMSLAGSAVADPSSPKENSSSRLQAMKERRAQLMRCFEQSASLFDDRISPADVVASAVAWHCEAGGNPENYWTILSMRRSDPDLNDAYYRDFALPFVLRQRVRRLQ
jgi:hypothetical protein